MKTMEKNELITNIEKLRNGEIKNLQVNVGGIDMILFKHRYFDMNCFTFRIDIDGNLSQILDEYTLHGLGIEYDFDCEDGYCIERAGWFCPIIEYVTPKRLIEYFDLVYYNFVCYLFASRLNSYRLADSLDMFGKEHELEILEHFKDNFEEEFYDLYREMLTTEDECRETELVNILWKNSFYLLKQGAILIKEVFYTHEPLTFKYKLQSVEGL